MNADQINVLFEELFNDLEEADDVRTGRPLLAHYTSIQVLESILKNEELWFSNPLFMNDLEEVRFGIIEGINAFQLTDKLEKRISDKEYVNLLRGSLTIWYEQFDKEHLINIYAFCLSQCLSGDILIH